MIVKPETYKNLIAVKDGSIIKIPNMVLRKMAPVEKQDANLTKNSICIVCNFRFLEDKMEWSKKVKAVCHPFRNGDIFGRIDKYLLSESDFCDKLTTAVDHRMSSWDKKKYDFVYFTLLSREGTRSKGLYLLPMINEAAKKLGLKGLIINYAKRETAKHKGTIYHKSLKQIKKLLPSMKNLKIIDRHCSSSEVCAIMKSVKFVLLPSDADASPRLLVEALVRNKPLVVNSLLYGGWKYINERTGAYFDGPTIEECYKDDYVKGYDHHLETLVGAMERVLSFDDLTLPFISHDFYKHYGFLNSVKKLAGIINVHSKTNYQAVAFKEWKKPLKKILGKL